MYSVPGIHIGSTALLLPVVLLLTFLLLHENEVTVLVCTRAEYTTSTTTAA